jgi:hypothetical protein
MVIRITDHIWSPASYVPLASALVSKRTACEAADPSIAAALLEPTRTVIQRENARVSARLRANMTCADAHAEAALILGTLALREAAKTFNDPRRLISRMTAHLAFATAMGISDENVTRRLAETILYARRPPAQRAGSFSAARSIWFERDAAVVDPRLADAKHRRLANRVGSRPRHAA